MRKRLSFVFLLTSFFISAHKGGPTEEVTVPVEGHVIVHQMPDVLLNPSSEATNDVVAIQSDRLDQLTIAEKKNFIDQTAQRLSQAYSVPMSTISYRSSNEAILFVMPSHSITTNNTKWTEDVTDQILHNKFDQTAIIKEYPSTIIGEPIMDWGSKATLKGETENQTFSDTFIPVHENFSYEQPVVIDRVPELRLVNDLEGNNERLKPPIHIKPDVTPQHSPITPVILEPDRKVSSLLDNVNVSVSYNTQQQRKVPFDASNHLVGTPLGNNLFDRPYSLYGNGNVHVLVTTVSPQKDLKLEIEIPILYDHNKLTKEERNLFGEKPTIEWQAWMTALLRVGHKEHPIRFRAFWQFNAYREALRMLHDYDERVLTIPIDGKEGHGLKHVAGFEYDYELRDVVVDEQQCIRQQQQKLIQQVQNASATQQHQDMDPDFLAELYEDAIEVAQDYLGQQEQERADLHIQRAYAIRQTLLNPVITTNHDKLLCEQAIRQNEYAPLFDECTGNQFDQHMHQELCSIVNTTATLGDQHKINPYPQALSPLIYHVLALAHEQQHPGVKTHLTDACHHMLRALQATTKLCAGLTKRVAKNIFVQKSEFVKGMLSCPLETLHKEYLHPLAVAGEMLGKAVYLACSDPKRLACGVTQRCSSLLDAAQQHPEELSALLLELFATQRLNKFMSIGKLVSALNKEKVLGKLAVETGKKVEEVKDAVIRPMQKVLWEVPTTQQSISILSNLYKKVSVGKGSTGRTIPRSLKEQIAMKEVLSAPLTRAKKLDSLVMNDKRWLTCDGWVKMSKNVNGVEIHYIYNTISKLFDDFKFKNF